MTDLLTRLEEATSCATAYLASGGLFNPELMEHDKVRDLVIDCRDALALCIAFVKAMEGRDE